MSKSDLWEKDDADVKVKYNVLRGGLTDLIGEGEDDDLNEDTSIIIGTRNIIQANRSRGKRIDLVTYNTLKEEDIKSSR